MNLPVFLRDTILPFLPSLAFISFHLFICLSICVTPFFNLTGPQVASAGIRNPDYSNSSYVQHMKNMNNI